MQLAQCMSLFMTILSFHSFHSNATQLTTETPRKSQLHRR